MVPTLVAFLPTETDSEFSMTGDDSLEDYHPTDTW